MAKKAQSLPAEDTAVAVAPPPAMQPQDGLGQVNGTSDLLAQIAANPSLGQLAYLGLVNKMESDAFGLAAMLQAGDVKTRVDQIKLIWDTQVESALRGGPEDAFITRSFITGQRGTVIQLLLSLNRMALANPEMRKEVESHVDAMIEERLARLRGPKPPLA